MSKDKIEAIFKKHWETKLKDKEDKDVSFQFALGYKMALKIVFEEIEKVYEK